MLSHCFETILYNTASDIYRVTKLEPKAPKRTIVTYYLHYLCTDQKQLSTLNLFLLQLNSSIQIVINREN